jgi:hypothetical protein
MPPMFLKGDTSLPWLLGFEVDLKKELFCASKTCSRCQELRRMFAPGNIGGMDADVERTRMYLQRVPGVNICRDSPSQLQ